MGKNIKWGILSTATIAVNAIIPAILSAKNSEAAAIASSNPKVDEWARKFNIKQVYRSYDELLHDEEIEAVYIPFPNHLHKEWVIKAAIKGKHVLVEKPAALTSEDVMEMVQICKEHKVLFMEAFMYQFQPQHLFVKEIIDSGEIGEVRHLSSTFTFPLNIHQHTHEFRLNAKHGGGSIWDVGCYCIHAAKTLIKEELKSVYVSGRFHPDHHVDMTATGILTFSRDVTASFHCSFEESFRNTYEIHGTKGTIFLPNAFCSDRVDGGLGEVTVMNGGGEIRTELFKANQYVLQMEHFAECILAGKEVWYSGTETFHNTRVIEACYQSLTEEKIVHL
ncbi:Gfo/Idh/MocA family oxidoreductase [Bacillus spongiae]|uniref:Gfo/Idh/MocA family oxidoreductase n=1 Tax=Bacillus spongiae TaxID=2683610 RepID=A0ABU8HEA3_9BACI